MLWLFHFFKDVFQSCGIEKEVLYEKNGSDEFIDSRANKYRCIAHNQDDLWAACLSRFELVGQHTINLTICYFV